ncbi:Glyoxylate reductase [uncultured archaeon]|nr:Glyoxylate reductase [uncultured archaeon]
MKNKIAITTTSFGDHDEMPLNLLKENGFEIAFNPYGRKLKKEEIIEFCKDVMGIVAGTETLDAEIIKKLTNLKVISRVGTGMDNVDLEAARSSGIKVFNTPDGPTSAVAELTVGLMLDLLRMFSQMDRELRVGKWEKRMGSLLYGKNVGIVGFGRIGKKVAELLKPFGCEIAYTDPYVKDGLLGLKRLSLEELLCWADIISLHVSVKDNKPLIMEKEFKLIKKGSWLVNVSRGGVVDENALYGALKSYHLSGAALDVFEHEPYKGSLIELDNIILTPHIGSYARESRIEMEKQAVENLLSGLKK